MFSKMKNIDTAFRHVKRFTMIVVGGSFLLCGAMMFKSYKIESITQSKVYVLADGKVFEAIAGDRKDNIPVEARDHIRTFHRLFFTLDPDGKANEENIGRALGMADATAKKQYQDLKENGFYAGIISGNISQRVSIDSIHINLGSQPYYFKCHGVETIIRSSGNTNRSLVTEGYLRPVNRSDNNPHGFLIERWAIVENKELKTP